MMTTKSNDIGTHESITKHELKFSSFLKNKEKNYDLEVDNRILTKDEPFVPKEEVLN